MKESRNPIFIRLSEQVLLEHNLYKQRTPGIDFLATLVCDFLHTSEYIETCLRQTRWQADFGPLSMENFVQYAIPIKLVHKYDFKISLPSYDEFIYHLSQLPTAKSYPASLKSTIIFLLKDVEIFDTEIRQIEQGLLDDARAAIKDRKFHVLPDILFGCRNQAFFSSNQLDELVNKYCEAWPREKISKFILFLQTGELPNEQLDKLVFILEQKIDEEFNSWIEPDIWFSIIESEKLVNSNIDEGDLRILLTNLKEAKVSWSDVIEDIEKDGVFLKLRNFAGKGGFASWEDVLSLISLKRAGRECVYVLDKYTGEEYRKLKEIGSDALSKKGVRLFAIINMLSIIALVSLNVHVDLAEQIKILLDANLSPATLKEIFYLLIQVPLVSVVLIVWNVNLWRNLHSNGTLTITSCFTTFPLVKKILTFFE